MGDTLLEEHFDGDGVPEGWYFQDGFSIISQTNHAGMAPNEVKMDGTMYPETFIQTPAIDLSGISQVNVSCRIDGLVIGPAYPGMSGFEMSISTSSDGGATWHNVSLGTFNPGWYPISVTIAIPDMGQSNVLFRINTDLKDRYIVFLDDIVMVGKPYGEWQDLHVTDTAVTLTGLSPETVYDVKVVPDCNENKESEIVTFTTANPCATPTNLAVGNLTATTAELSWDGYSLTGYEVEYYTTAIIDEVLNEGFEGGTLPEGWTIEGDNQDPATTWRVGVGDAYQYSYNIGTHSGDYNALITHTQDGDETFLVTPPLNLGAYDALELSFWYINRIRSISSRIDLLTVYYRIGEEGEWNELWSTGFNRHQYWTHQTLTLTGLADNCQIGFMMYDRNGTGVGLDDIVITNLVAPAGEPMTLTVEEGTTATLTGLSANTAYEVRVKANCDAAEYCSPVAFTTADMSVSTQTTTLAAGWNWWSTYLEITNPIEMLQTLEAALGENGIQIKNSNISTEYDSEWGWFGDLDEVGFTNEEMIMIKTDNACTFELQGEQANPANHPITIYPGWNWIGYPCAEAMTLNQAFSNFTPEEGDQIKNSDGSSEYDSEWGWFGDVENLVPGHGFMYYSSSAVAKTLVFQTGRK